MGNKIKLNELIDEMDFQMEGYTTYVNTRRGELVAHVSDELLIKIEDEELEEDQRSWEQEMIDEAKDIVENFIDYLEIPSQEDFNEYEIMEDFALNVEPPHVSDRLIRAIKGRGAFRRFKDTVIELGVAEQWYSYKNEQLKEFAKQWCEEFGVDYTEE